MTIRAAVLRQPGAPLTVEELTLHPTAAHQVRVAVAASGVCHSDLSLATGVLPSVLPVVLGHEGAGTVVEVGADVADLQVGDHVVLSWLPACRRCVHCTSGQPFLCEDAVARTFAVPYADDGADQQVYCGLGTGTFGTETLVDASAVVRVPDDVPLETAALVGCAVATGVGAVLNTAQVRPGSSVVVIGCGGVGLSAVMGARHAGADKLVAVDTSKERLALAEALGATDTVVAGDDTAAHVQAACGGGADYAFEVVGRSQTMRLAWDVTRRGGVVTVVGVGAPDDQVSFSALELPVMGKTLHGCVYGSVDPPRDFPRLIELYRSGELPVDRLVTSRIGVGDVNEAFAAMQRGEGARSLVLY